MRLPAASEFYCCMILLITFNFKFFTKLSLVINLSTGEVFNYIPLFAPAYTIFYLVFCLFLV